MARSAVAVLVLLAAPVARADDTRVALLADDATVRDAVTLALEPWRLQVVPLAAWAPPADVSSAIVRAQKLAERERAGAVVWLAGSGAEWSLFVYDVETRQLIARGQIAAPPYDAAAAAALALSVKSLLRASTVAPPLERVAAVSDAMARRTQLRLEALVGARGMLGDPRALELRLGVGIAWFPRRLRQHFGLGLDVRAGPGVGLDEASFAGRLLDVALSLSARTRIEPARRLALEPMVAVSARFTTLDGTLPATGVHVRADRVDPALDGGMAIDVHVGQSIHLGVVILASYLIRYQRYLVNGTPVLSLFPFELEAALRFTAGVL